LSEDQKSLRLMSGKEAVRLIKDKLATCFLISSFWEIGGFNIFKKHHSANKFTKAKGGQYQ